MSDIQNEIETKDKIGFMDISCLMCDTKLRCSVLKLPKTQETFYVRCPKCGAESKWTNPNFTETVESDMPISNLAITENEVYKMVYWDKNDGVCITMENGIFSIKQGSEETQNRDSEKIEFIKSKIQKNSNLLEEYGDFHGIESSKLIQPVINIEINEKDYLIDGNSENAGFNQFYNDLVDYIHKNLYTKKNYRNTTIGFEFDCPSSWMPIIEDLDMYASHPLFVFANVIEQPNTMPADQEVVIIESCGKKDPDAFERYYNTIIEKTGQSDDLEILGKEDIKISSFSIKRVFLNFKDRGFTECLYFLILKDYGIMITCPIDETKNIKEPNNIENLTGTKMIRYMDALIDSII